MNNRQRKAQAARERMDTVLYVRVRRRDGQHNVYPIRYLVPDDRRAFLARAVSPL